MCCCCPPAINALFCLWFQSGCSKGSVAGALTFFPPDPPLYKFERYSVSGQLLPDESDNQDVDDDEPDERAPVTGGSADELNVRDDEELMDIVGPTGCVVAPLEEKRMNRGHNDESEKRKPPPSAAQQLTERARELRKRAKVRNQRDAADAKAGVTYRLLLDPRIMRSSANASLGTTVQAVKIPSTKGVYVASLIYRVPRPTPSTKTIIYSHGNATDIGAMFPMQSILVQSLEANVVCYDYSGYGESGGVAQENNTYSDIKAVYNYCVEHVATNPKNIILYGQSVGSGPVCHLAYKNQDVGGIILHSPFTSGMRVLTPSRLLACLDIYPNINRIQYVKCPVMVIHGKQDEEVNFHHGLEMHRAVPPQYRRDPWWVPDRGHNDITEGQGKLGEYIRRLRRFMDTMEEE